MPNWKEPHWPEGMLLLPHHLQAAQRYWDAIVGEAFRTSGPFAWGFDELKISDPQIGNGMFHAERFKLRTMDGTWLVAPGNCEPPARQFGEALRNSPDGLLVYLAVPRLNEVRRNATYPVAAGGQPTRYTVERLERRDENTGDNVRQIEVHGTACQLFFGQEAETPSFEAVPVARLYLSGEAGGAPRRDESYIPPLLRVAASEELSRMLRDVFYEVGQRGKELVAEVQKRQMTFRSGVEEHMERLLMLHVLNEAGGWLRQGVLALTDLRPSVLYAELCRLAGQLSVFTDPDRGLREYPLYDHLRIGENFKLVCDHIRNVLLRPFQAGLLKWRDFERREDGKGLKVALEGEWLDGTSEFYVGIHTTHLTDLELDQLLRSLDWKIASLADVDVQFTGGLSGLELRPVRVPGGVLPANKDIKYYQVMRDAELWPRVVDSHSLAIRYSPAGQARLEGISFKIYVVLTRR